MSFYAFLPELVVDLLVEDERLSVHVKDPDVVGSLEVVLDKADHATGPFVPSITVTRTLTSVHLNQSLGCVNGRRSHLKDGWERGNEWRVVSCSPR